MCATSAKDDIDEAYKEQALAAFEEKPVRFNGVRRPFPVWSCSNTDICVFPGDKKYSILRYKHGRGEIDLRSGTHRWTMEVIDGCLPRIGIMLPSDPSETAQKSRFWTFGPCSYVTCDGNLRELPREYYLHTRGTATFTLDLRPGIEGSGTLKLTMGVLPEVTIASNLLQVLDEHPKGFQPVARMREGGSLRIVDFRKLPD